MNEIEQSTSQFRKAMLAAFRHGREFESLQSDSDLSEETGDKNLPFSEWFNKYYREGKNNAI